VVGDRLPGLPCVSLSSLDLPLRGHGVGGGVWVDVIVGRIRNPTVWENRIGCFADIARNERLLPLVRLWEVILASEWSCGDVGEADRVREVWVVS